jgi:hypothetical protein
MAPEIGASSGSAAGGLGARDKRTAVAQIMNVALSLMGTIGFIGLLIMVPIGVILYTRRTLKPGVPYDERSGKGDASVIPPEINGWNWGAAFLGFYWGLCYRVWIMFVSFVPIIGGFWWIVMGVKGNEWAWRKSKWLSVEHFKKTQRKWTPWAIAILVIGILGAILWWFVFSAAVLGIFATRSSLSGFENYAKNVNWNVNVGGYGVPGLNLELNTNSAGLGLPSLGGNSITHTEIDLAQGLTYTYDLPPADEYISVKVSVKVRERLQPCVASDSGLGEASGEIVVKAKNINGRDYCLRRTLLESETQRDDTVTYAAVASGKPVEVVLAAKITQCESLATQAAIESCDEHMEAFAKAVDPDKLADQIVSSLKFTP